MSGQTSATASWRTMALITAMVALGAVFYTRLLWGSFHTFVLRMDNCELTFCDFVRHYWRMGHALMETHQPVPGFFYSPFFALLMVPLGALAKTTAVAVWGVVQGLSLLALFVAPLLPPATRRPLPYAVYAIAFAVSVPLYHNLKWGQISVLLTALTLWALELERRGRPVLAGALLAFATALKGYVVVFAVIFAARRQSRALIAFAVGLFTFAVIVPVIFLGPADAWHFYQLVNTKLAGAQAGIATNPNSQSFASVIARWGTDPQTPVPTPLAAVRGLGFVLAAGNFVVAWRWLRDPDGHGPAVALLFLSLPLLLQTSWPHYFAYLPAVIAVGCQRWWTLASWPWWRILGGAWILGGLFLTSLPALQLAGRWYLYSRAGWLLVANLALMGWFYADRFLPLRRPPA